MLRTSTPVPLNVPEGTRWNFTYDFSAGLQHMSDSDQAFRWGYRFHHLSNADRTPVNPGLDSHVIFAGYSWFH